MTTPTHKLTVANILPYAENDLGKMRVELFASDEEADFHNSVTVEVFIPKKNYSLSELEADAKKEALKFLQELIERSRP